jgi:hypothetical protein
MDVKQIWICPEDLKNLLTDFEYDSFELLKERGHKVERIDSAQMRKRFPAWNADLYPDGFLDHESGYAESGRVVGVLVEHAKSLGVQLRENCRFAELDDVDSRVHGIVLTDGTKITGDVVVGDADGGGVGLDGAMLGAEAAAAKRLAAKQPEPERLTVQRQEGAVKLKFYRDEEAARAGDKAKAAKKFADGIVAVEPAVNGVECVYTLVLDAKRGPLLSRRIVRLPS